MLSHSSLLRPDAYFHVLSHSSSFPVNQPRGRFLTANVVKALLARILITYDFKFEEGEVVPREHHIASFRRPGNATFLFRKRQNIVFTIFLCLPARDITLVRLTH